LQTKLAELGQPNLQVKFIEHQGAARPGVDAAAPVAGSEPSAAPAPPPAAAGQAEPRKAEPAQVVKAKDDFKNDPLIQKALEVFKGQIVDVRS
jgi:DNA polymerase-3 subunit gamma/tau